MDSIIAYRGGFLMSKRDIRGLAVYIRKSVSDGNMCITKCVEGVLEGVIGSYWRLAAH